MSWMSSEDAQSEAGDHVGLVVALAEDTTHEHRRHKPVRTGSMVHLLVLSEDPSVEATEVVAVALVTEEVASVEADPAHLQTPLLVHALAATVVATTAVEVVIGIVTEAVAITTLIMSPCNQETAIVIAAEVAPDTRPLNTMALDMAALDTMTLVAHVTETIYALLQAEHGKTQHYMMQQTRKSSLQAKI